MELGNNNNCFFHLSPSSSYLHSLKVDNCDSNSRLVVDEDYNGNFKLESVLNVVVFFIGCVYNPCVMFLGDAADGSGGGAGGAATGGPPVPGLAVPGAY